MAAAARPEPIRFRFEPRFPFRFQGILRACLKHAINNDRDAEWASFPVRLRNEDPLDRKCAPKLPLMLHPQRQGRLARSGQHDLPVHTGGHAASILLRHPPHADQRVGVRTEHQLLQIADPFEVPCLTRRENPLPQTAHVLLGGTPINSVPLHKNVRRSVHVSGDRLGVQLVLRLRHIKVKGFFTDSPGPRQLPCGPGTSSRIQPVIQDDHWKPVVFLPVSCRLSAAGIRFLDHPVPLEISAFLTVGLPRRSTRRLGPQPGFPRSTRVRYDRGGCPLYPGAVVSTRATRNEPLGTRRFPTASPTALLRQPIDRASAVTRHQPRVHSRSPVRSSPRPWLPGWNGGPPAFPRAPHPAVTSNARRGGDRSPGH